jgi:hypothetical protein
MKHEHPSCLSPTPVERMAAASGLGLAPRGGSGRAIAQALGVTPGAVSQ